MPESSKQKKGTSFFRVIPKIFLPLAFIEPLPTPFPSRNATLPLPYVLPKVSSPLSQTTLYSTLTRQNPCVFVFGTRILFLIYMAFRLRKPPFRKPFRGINLSFLFSFFVNWKLSKCWWTIFFLSELYQFHRPSLMVERLAGRPLLFVTRWTGLISGLLTWTGALLRIHYRLLVMSKKLKARHKQSPVLPSPTANPRGVS